MELESKKLRVVSWLLPSYLPPRSTAVDGQHQSLTSRACRQSSETPFVRLVGRTGTTTDTHGDSHVPPGFPCATYSRSPSPLQRPPVCVFVVHDSPSSITFTSSDYIIVRNREPILRLNIGAGRRLLNLNLNELLWCAPPTIRSEHDGTSALLAGLPDANVPFSHWKSLLVPKYVAETEVIVRVIVHTPQKLADADILCCSPLLDCYLATNSVSTATHL